ncbi:hypothetical protein EVAR_89426_1 [Eumeta japonica]|uniref:Uncharacterized protein n=1 Tax=Eumeta variegata TaxID=151549 RepID=A0A4C1Z604_EUMVA|nr:hypothetical protein EVAR_89426_1 [Eumeta japonica]
MPSRSRPIPPGANAGRPACVCAAEHARRAPRFTRCAPDRRIIPGTVAATNVRNALVRPPPVLIGRCKCPTSRAYHTADGEAPVWTSWEQLL